MKNIRELTRKVDEVIIDIYDFEHPTKCNSPKYQMAILDMLKEMFPYFTIAPLDISLTEAKGLIYHKESGRVVYYRFQDFLTSEWKRLILLRKVDPETMSVSDGPETFVNIDELKDQVIAMLQ